MSQGRTGSAPANDSAVSLPRNHVCKAGACIPFPQLQCVLRVKIQTLSQYSALPMPTKGSSPGSEPHLQGQEGTKKVQPRPSCFLSTQTMLARCDRTQVGAEGNLKCTTSGPNFQEMRTRGLVGFPSICCIILLYQIVTADGG